MTRLTARMVPPSHWKRILMAFADWVRNSAPLLLSSPPPVFPLAQCPCWCCNTARPLGSRDGAQMFNVVVSGGLGDCSQRQKQMLPLSDSITTLCSWVRKGSKDAANEEQLQLGAPPPAWSSNLLPHIDILNWKFCSGGKVTSFLSPLEVFDGVMPNIFP